MMVLVKLSRVGLMNDHIKIYYREWFKEKICKFISKDVAQVIIEGGNYLTAYKDTLWLLIKYRIK